MPFARLTLIPAPAPEQASRLAAELTDLVAGDLGKRHDLTSILIETPGEALWTIGGQPRASAAHLEVCVTAGTNSDEEKRTFVANAMRMLKAALPGLDPATYVIVKEVPGSDWGFDGRTQADRARERN
ncbi:hypothetical protein [Stappia sp. MMSF_3263]|uniref:tautomerase family protein n=1 Tax=Stappia sp. MMSF_3263 TaxID=3046693 RepID=UPI00273CFC71|nr:hypothetical protein [Stappia sp. MMSF_3263]